MLIPTPSGYARLPTFSAVIDGLASGLGIARNKEDALASLGSFGGRIDTYSGSTHRSGLQDRLLDLLAGSNEALRSLVQARLLDAETALTDARSIPLVTEATEAEGAAGASLRSGRPHGLLRCLMLPASTLSRC